MNSKVINFVVFAVGVAVGSAATYALVKKKYELLAQEEIDSVKEAFANRPARVERTEEKVVEDAIDEDIKVRTEAAIKSKPDLSEYKDQVTKQGYTDYTEMYPTKTPKKKKNKEEVVVKKEVKPGDPFVISPSEFGEKEDEYYDIITLHFYADNKLVDGSGELIDDVDETVGYDSLNHFGEFEEDTVFVRNDRLKCDFEILRELGNFEDLGR